MPIDVMRRADRVHDEIELPLKCVQRARLLGRNEALGTKSGRVFLLAARRAQHGDVGTHRACQLDGHVANTAQAHDSDLFPWLAAESTQGRVCRDARAHERCGARGVQPLRDSKHVALVDDHVRRVPSVRPGLLALFEAVKRERDTLLAEHLVARAAFPARSARIDDAAHPDEFALAEAGFARTLGYDSADDLVAWHDRKVRVLPVVIHLVHVAVADAAIADLNLDVVRSRIASLDGHRRNRRLGRAGTAGRSLLGHGRMKTRARVRLLCSPPDVTHVGLLRPASDCFGIPFDSLDLPILAGAYGPQLLSDPLRGKILP